MVDVRLPRHARAVIIGGGIMGCSVAYHLAKLGWHDIVLLERHELGCGTSWHSAANFSRLGTSAASIKLFNYSRDVHAQLETETGLTVGWRKTGRVQLARTPHRLESYKHIVSLGRGLGLDFALVTPREIGDRLPVLRIDDLMGGIWSPGDGRVNPTDYLTAYARAARSRGVTFIDRTPVTGFRKVRNSISSVMTANDEIACDVAVNCAGFWARQVGALCGVNVPLYPVEHFYLLTKPIAGIPRNMPAFRDPDALIYGREEVGGLLLGCFDKNAKAVAVEELPNDFAFGLLNEDWDQFAPYMREAVHRVPALETAEVRTLLNGPESFTPDGRMIMGEATNVRGFFTLAGMNSAGMVMAAGAGRALAEWIAEGSPTIDVSAFDIRRFSGFHGNEAWLRERVREVPSHFYRMHRSAEDFTTGRMQWLSPMHERLSQKGARFGSVSGWERPIWFAGPDGRADQRSCVVAEQHAARSGIAVFDKTSLGKLRLNGSDATTTLARIANVDPNIAIGSVCVTPFLNPRGGIESLPIIARDGDQSWLLLTSPGQVVRDADWIDRHIVPGCDVTLSNVTHELADIVLQGPASLTLIDHLTGATSVTEALSSDACRDILIGDLTVTLLRCPLTCQLHMLVHVDDAGRLYDHVFSHHDALELRDAGHLADEALRLEQAVPAWGQDIGPTVTAIEAGLLRDRRDDPGPRPIGWGANAGVRERPPKRQLRSFILTEEPNAPLACGEPIWGGDECVGFASSAAFVASLGRSVIMGLLSSRIDAPGYTLDAAGQMIALESYKPQARQ
jgi:4-methylaminobutanoate oxidase (formaldehyde-forming)